MSSCEQLQKKAVPAAMNELEETIKSIPQIAQYCRDAYATSDPDEVYKTTVNYTSNILANLAYHTHNVAQQLTKFLDSQADAIDSLALEMSTISLRLNAMKEATGAQGLRRTGALKEYQRSARLTKLSKEQMSPTSQPMHAWKRLGRVDYNNADAINQAVIGRKHHHTK